MEKQMLDFILVPSGLVVLVGYHLWLWQCINNHPTKTVIGINSINRSFWVHAMIEDTSKNGVLAVQTLRNNIMASTLLASTAIMLSSVIAVLINGKGQSIDNVLGDTSALISTIKFFSILVCFLVAFLLNVQSIRYFSHASVLVNVPFKKLATPYLTADYVVRIVNRGSYFWSLGLRAFYFSFPIFLWIFGPLPMFLSCVSLVFMLYFLDTTSDFRAIDGECGGKGQCDVEQA
ncbi:hypothetical protein V2J09_005736 [Rumex salicifolius]